MERLKIHGVILWAGRGQAAKSIHAESTREDVHSGTGPTTANRQRTQRRVDEFVKRYLKFKSRHFGFVMEIEVTVYLTAS